MESPVIDLQDVWKAYANVTALRGIRLSVPARSVYAFLGPNGAGKTTTIRLILGLHKADRGSISVFGKSLESHRIAALERTGSLVESPSLYAHLTARENLEVQRRLRALPKTAIDEALRTVGLLAAADRLVKTYSLGMRQRLGIAWALLGNPELLVLDEPTNGLDPAGIHEIRCLVRELPKTRGVTVFLSSHLLAEVEQVATHFAILSDGMVRFQGTPDELRTLSRPTVIIEVDQPERGLVILSEAGCRCRLQESRIVSELDDRIRPAAMNSLLVQAGLKVSHLSISEATLEHLFLQLTQKAEPTHA